MSSQLRGAYWKLWHDTRGRVVASALLVAATLFGVFSQHGNPRPKPCRDGVASTPWPELLSEYQGLRMELARTGYMVEAPGPNGPRKVRADVELPTLAQLADGNVLAAHCKGQTPNWMYMVQAQTYRSRTLQNAWGAMPIVMLFVGILLSVGPPFSGESHEAFSLTFSLPWSRERWLAHRVALSMIVMCALTLCAYLVVSAAVHFPYTGELYGGYPVNEFARYLSGLNPARTLLAGMVGIALGTLTSLYSRNVLTAAVAAGAIAYVLININSVAGMPFDVIADFREAPLLLSTTMLTSVSIMLATALLAARRLRNRDF